MKAKAKNIKPVNGQIFVVDDEKEGKTEGGIFLPENADSNRMIEGNVLAISPFMLEGGKLMDPPFVAGMKVIYSQHAGAGNTWEEDKRVYRLIKCGEVLAVVTK